MTDTTVLPSRDRSAGFWAVSERNGYDPRTVWEFASTAVARVFALTAVEVRDLLDSDVGALLANDITFLEDGPTDAAAIEMLLSARLRHAGWQRLYQQAVAHVQACRRPVHNL